MVDSPEAIKDDLNHNFLLACFQSDVSTVKLYIKTGIDVNLRDKEGTTGLMIAKSSEVVKALIQAGADVNLKNFSGNTALMFSMNNSEKIELLINAGAEVDAADVKGRTALMLTKDPKVVALLIKARANVNASDNLSTTALMYAVMSNLNMLPKRSYKDNERHQTIQLLIDAGAWINYRRKGDKKTALMLVEKLTDAIILVECGADVTLQDSTGKLAHQQNRYRGSEPEKIEVYLKACFDDDQDGIGS